MHDSVAVMVVVARDRLLREELGKAAMISLGIIFLAGGTYLLGWYKLAFWIIAFGIGLALLEIVKAITSPEGYWARRQAAGDERASLSARGARGEGPDSRIFVPSLLVDKGILIVILGLGAAS
jgi:hypothetical protein